MPTLDTYRKQAKLILRWNRQGDYSVGGKVRQLARFSHLTDREVLSLKVNLALAQEIVAAEAGYRTWAELKAAAAGSPKNRRPVLAAPKLEDVIPILVVRNVTSTAEFFREKLGFQIEFLHGSPPFYGAVSRDGVCLHLRFVHDPYFAAAAAQEESLLVASIQVANVQRLFEEFKKRGVTFAQKLKKQACGGTDFIVRDPDGNAISFVTYEKWRRD